MNYINKLFKPWQWVLFCITYPAWQEHSKPPGRLLQTCSQSLPFPSPMHSSISVFKNSVSCWFTLSPPPLPWLWAQMVYNIHSLSLNQAHWWAQGQLSREIIIFKTPRTTQDKAWPVTPQILLNYFFLKSPLTQSPTPWFRGECWISQTNQEGHSSMKGNPISLTKLQYCSSKSFVIFGSYCMHMYIMYCHHHHHGTYNNHESFKP